MFSNPATARPSFIVQLLLTLWLFALGCNSSWAISRSTLQIEALSGAGWQAQQLRIAIRVDTPAPQADIRIGQLQVQGSAEPLRNLHIVCPDVELQLERFACAQARIEGVFPYLGPQKIIATASYGRERGGITLDLQQITLGSAQATLQAQLNERGWQAQATLPQAEVNALLQVMQKLGFDLDLSGAGRINAQVQLAGQGSAPQRLDWQISGDKLVLNNTAGTLASDQLTVNTQGQATHSGNTWQVAATLSSASGQAYAEPVFVDFGQHALEVALQARWDGQSTVQVQQLQLRQQNLIAAQISGVLNLSKENPVPELDVQLAQLLFPGAFATYMQPFLLDSAFKNLSSSGTVQGSAIIRNSWPTQVDAKLVDLNADTGNQQLSLAQVNAELHWRDTVSEGSEPPRSTVNFASGTLLGLQLGASQIPLELWGSTLRFAAPARIPVFNGALAIDALRIRKLGTPQMAFLLDAEIEPINVAQLAKAFGWPEFGGELSGKITKLRLEEGVVSVGSTLRAQVFDGEISISDMRMENALSEWPRFSANIKLDNLDMEQVTQAFSFGRITGRVSGEINQLNLFNWAPASFDARFYTPANDRSRHRISQRAVQNIGSVGGSGGGVAAALQSGFLKFFDEFNYDRLGIACKLSNEVCAMSGVEPAKGGGYYLVKGKGLPRIDVIGNSTRVDWPRLMNQLQAVMESEGAVVR